MADAPAFSELSPARQLLVRLCQSTNYGHIEDLLVREREPVIDPAAVVSLDLKLDSEEHSRAELKSADFLPCGELVRLMGLLDRIDNGKISRLEVRAGVPRRVLFEHRISQLVGMAP